MRQLKTTMLVALCVALCGIPAGAEEYAEKLDKGMALQMPRETDIEGFVKRKALQALSGLNSLQVTVEEIRPDAEEDGLSKTVIQTDVELRLRKAGMRVVSTDEERLKIPGCPWLYVDVQTAKIEAIGFYVYSVRIELYERVLLERGPGLRTIAKTWSTGGGIGWVRQALVRNLREYVADSVDEFLNSWLAANPIDRSKIERKKESD